MAAPFAHKVNRVTIMGDCFSSSEHWNTGFYIGAAAADAASPHLSAGVIAPFWNTFFTNASTKVSNVYRTLQIKVAQLKTDGTTDLDNVDWYDYPTPPVGPNAAVAYPPQCSVVATLTSEVQRGLAAKGRMYLPGLNPTLSTSTGKISSTDAGTIATNFKTFLDAVNAASGSGGKVILASHGHRGGGPPPDPYLYAGMVNTLVTGCRVGDVIDTQRRRRNELPEVYTTRVLA